MARYALVIGIAEYLSPSLPRLSKTTNDAEAIAQLLEQYGDFQSVQRLPQRWNKDKNGYEMGAQKVTGAQLGQDLRTFLLEQATNNEALIYFSGHGFTISDNLGQQKGYLASSDCQIEFKDNENVEQKYGIPLNSLNDLIRDSQLSSLVMLLDCCHSGYFLERQLIERTLNAFSSQKDYYLITACRGFERAGVIKTEEYSIFTGAVVKGLAAENAGNSRRISGDRLFDFVSNELKGSVQEPIRMGWGRSITLVTYPQLDIPTGEKIAFNQENPYRGLYAFESEQAQYFCGRDEAVRTLISRLAESRFLAVIGYSGSGKSSLVKAGLLPQLKGDRLPGSSEWAIASFTPGEHPLGKLVNILARQLQQNQPHLLFIDQFEEIFTLCQDDEERKAFIRLIAQEVKKAEVETRIILTIRGDFLNRCADYREIITLINNIPPTSFIITPMSFAELEEAIEKPAKLHGVIFERGLVSQISADVVNRPGVLPILQYALKELWRVCIEEPDSPEPLLTRKGYEEIGGVKGALDKRATILYESLTTIDQAFARCLFMELVQLGEAGEVTRRRASWDRLEVVADSSQQLQRVVGLLAGSQQRLIITDQNTVEVAHEALLSEWKLLNTWITENLENIRLSRSLEEDCQEWVQRFNKSDDALLTGANLAVLSEWVNKTQPRLTPLESEFLHKSLERRDRQNQAELEQAKKLQREAEAKAKAESQRTRFAIASAILVAVCGGLGSFAWQLSTKNSLKDKIASGALIASPELLLQTGNQLDAMIASVQVLKQFQDLGIDNADALNRLKLVIDKVQEHNRLEGHTDSVTSVSVSPTENLIVSGSKDKTVKLWRFDGTLVKTMTHDAAVYSVNFSPDGQYIVSGGDDKKVKLWKKDGTFLDSVTEDQNIYFVNFSPDNKIISTTVDGTVKLWKYNSSKIIQKPYKTILENGKNKVWSAEFSNNNIGENIVTAADDGNIRIFTKDGTLVATLPAHIATATYAAFGLNNDTIISSSYDDTVKMWQEKNNKQWSEIKRVKANNPYKVTFSPNYKIIAATSIDGNIQLWKDAQLTQQYFIGRHLDKINDLSFSKDSKWIVTASRDQTLRIWSLDSQPQDTSQANTASLLKKGCSWLSEYLNNNDKAHQKYVNVRQICEMPKTRKI
ncbi:nSTAND1 domain-containing NTPase [Nostoc sp. 'Lobaria pulmonaria (5183) cyanobiont']|uniref:nSTAND1 domain-containing NTPase n=1 Tax=Nostoc sp. 'Lobaria pulmonaria (5183) cyanobiont' TaxID=1618022 RepID=UPI000CF35361|nr:caspase family protein [Nostoc sp. 'Lobaria pulmonaria (5183) cyanobiont']AVH69461.1 WD40 repeat-containing protein [Nostoc sp. 'Lobaria pulmonaria (5183) cyanobiont']